jgi:hypothetical protein
VRICCETIDTAKSGLIGYLPRLCKAVQALPPEQQKVLEYAQTLQRQEDAVNTRHEPGSWRNDPAFGMWKDREDMKDSVEWVRQIRKQHWHSDQ